MSTWEEKFNALQNQYQSIQSEHEYMKNQYESIQKEFEEYKKDKANNSNVSAGMDHGLYDHNLIFCYLNVQHIRLFLHNYIFKQMEIFGTLLCRN